MCRPGIHLFQPSVSGPEQRRTRASCHHIHTSTRLRKFINHRPSLHLGTGLDDLRSGLILVLLEVLTEQLAKLRNLTLEVGRTSPALGGVEELVGNVRAGLGDLEVEGLVGLVLGLGEVATVDGVEDGAGVLERAALAAGGGAGTDPAGVQEPGVGLVLLDLVREHLGVAHGVQGEEGLGEAGGEGSLWLSDTLLGTGHLGGVAGNEVEHGLLSVELGNRWKDAASVAGEEDDVGRVGAGDAGDLGVLDVLDGVSAAGVLGQGGIVVVDNTGDGIEDDVLEDGTELDGVENVGLLLGGQANALGVASTFDVEDAPVSPAVLVVTDQSTLRVSGEGGLAGTGQTEEDGDVAILALVGGRVQGQDVVLDRHLVEEDGEDTWLLVSIGSRIRFLGVPGPDACVGSFPCGP